MMLDDGLVARLDRRVGARRRSTYIAEAIRRALDDDERWVAIESALGTIKDRGHDWDLDSAAWVRAQRQGDVRRVG
jgi:hypothetical protein